MGDEKLRELEREWKITGEAEALLALNNLRSRLGLPRGEEWVERLQQLQQENSELRYRLRMLEGGQARFQRNPLAKRYYRNPGLGVQRGPLDRAVDWLGDRFLPQTVEQRHIFRRKEAARLRAEKEAYWAGTGPKLEAGWVPPQGYRHRFRAPARYAELRRRRMMR